MKSRSSNLLRMVPMAVIMGTIFFLSHQPGDDLLVLTLPGADKIGHFVLYALLAWATLLSFSQYCVQKQPRKVVLITVTICVFYGISDEIHQIFIPGRFASVLDILADCAGTLLTCTLWLWYQRKAKPAHRIEIP